MISMKIAFAVSPLVTPTTSVIVISMTSTGVSPCDGARRFDNDPR